MNNLINIINALEIELIQQNIYNEYFINEKETQIINANLSLTGQENIAFKVHQAIINTLISIYLKSKHRDSLIELKKVFTFYETDKVDNIVKNQIEQIPNLIEEIHINFLNSLFSFSNGQLKRSKSKHFLKEYGAVYTLKRVSNEIVDKTISNALKSTKIKDLKCLDFASGTGRFYFEALEIFKNKYSLNLKEIVCNHLYAIDVDEVALNILKCKVISLFDEVNDEILSNISNNILHRNALISVRYVRLWRVSMFEDPVK